MSVCNVHEGRDEDDDCNDDFNDSGTRTASGPMKMLIILTSMRMKAWMRRGTMTMILIVMATMTKMSRRLAGGHDRQRSPPSGRHTRSLRPNISLNGLTKPKPQPIIT